MKLRSKPTSPIHIPILKTALLLFLPSMLFFIGESQAAAPASAASPSSQNGNQDTGLVKESLDQAKIHDVYNSGDFEPVISVLEAFVKRNKTYSQSDSVFIAKHLAVVYSANPATREKGKYYMFRLLELLPSAKLIDMYVSEEVDRIFDKVREEFVGRQRGFGVEPKTINLPDRPGRTPASDPEVKPKESHAWIVWSCVAGGTALLAGGGYLWYQNQDQATTASPEPLAIKVITPKN